MKNQLEKIFERINIKRSIWKRKSKDVFLSMVSNPTLSELGKIYGTDKADRNHTFNNLSYLDIYEKYLFEYLFNNRLKSGGIYIIEDLKASYRKLQTNLNVIENWPGMKYNDPSINFDNDRKDMDDFFAEKIMKLDHFQGNIMCLHFWSMICVIIKTR